MANFSRTTSAVKSGIEFASDVMTICRRRHSVYLCHVCKRLDKKKQDSKEQTLKINGSNLAHDQPSSPDTWAKRSKSLIVPRLYIIRSAKLYHSMKERLVSETY